MGVCEREIDTKHVTLADAADTSDLVSYIQRLKISHCWCGIAHPQRHLLSGRLCVRARSPRNNISKSILRDHTSGTDIEPV